MPIDDSVAAATKRCQVAIQLPHEAHTPDDVCHGFTVTSAPEMPEGLELVRTTALWDEHTVPAGVLSGHRVADGAWGRLVVRSGAVGFVFEDEPDVTIQVATGDTVAIPPGRLHHVVLDGPATFVVEFYRQPSEPASS